MVINQSFKKKINNHWTFVAKRGAKTFTKSGVLYLGFDTATRSHYTDAQVDDYTLVPTSEYIWRPNTRLSIYARFSIDQYRNNDDEAYLKGTAGFGFWNRPFSMQGKWFRAPKSIWFFHSAPPSKMHLDPSVSPWGFKTQVVNTTLRSVLINAMPLFCFGLIGRIRSNKQAGYYLKKLSGADEHVIDLDITKWHRYEIVWAKKSVVFSIDGQVVYSTQASVKAKLGFVAWVDNEYAVVGPDLRLSFGHTDTLAQWLEVKEITLSDRIST